MVKKYSLYTISLATFLALFLVSLGYIYILTVKYRQDLLAKEIEEKINFARAFHDIRMSPRWTQLASLAELEKEILSFAPLQDIKYVRMMDSSGNIEHSSVEGERGRRIEDPGIAQAILSGKTVIQDEVVGGEKLKKIVFPWHEAGVVSVGFPLRGIEEATRTAFIRDISIALGGVTFTLLYFFLIFRSIINPVRKITLACEQIRKGNLEVEIKNSPKTEIGELASSINNMVRDLKKSQEILEETKSALEVRVEARTRELTRVADSLDQKVKEKTQELQEKINDLERFQKLAVGRELKMIELKKELEDFKGKNNE
ncbi:MAG: HAMP domain-containing protein [Candidatus Nealsonbacteria bacterium]|nr:HAMP domain-containing protein [Candidatus Nealsonbacteria bacterium]